jgi:cytochrome P450
LYDLSSHPDSILPIRQEIEALLGEHAGEWTKHTVSMMRKLDSSLKESQRLHPVTTAVSMRKALRPYTLPDGTHLPKGVWAVVPAYSINRSKEYYDDPETFDAFRFSRKEEDGGKHGGEGMAHPDENGYVSFGIGGKNAW